MIIYTPKKGSNARLTVGEAFSEAESITASSSARKIVRVLASLHNRVLVPRLFTERGLLPVKQWMRKGGAFEVLSRDVFAAGQALGPGQIYSWRYFPYLADGPRPAGRRKRTRRHSSGAGPDPSESHRHRNDQRVEGSRGDMSHKISKKPER